MDSENNVTTTPTAGPSVPTTADVRRDEENFIEGYANHIAVESNAFDLKMVFGLYDHRAAPKPVVNQFSSMNISWPEVKILIFFLQLHVAGYELDNGNIKVPDSAIPPELPPLPETLDNPKARQAYEMLKKMREEFVASLKG